MADQANDGSQVTEEKENGLEVAGQEEVFRCNYCDKVFSCSRALGGHQNAHRMERSASRRSQVQQYDPFGPYVNIPPPPQFTNISNSEPAQARRQPLMHLPHYRHDCAPNSHPTYVPHASHGRQPLSFPSRYSNRYQPYHFTYVSNSSVHPVANYNPRLSFENLSYPRQVQAAAEPPSVNRGLNEEFVLNWLFNPSNEQGSFFGENLSGVEPPSLNRGLNIESRRNWNRNNEQGSSSDGNHDGHGRREENKEDKKDDKREELDLTLRL